jgi:hypothetical protein
VGVRQHPDLDLAFIQKAVVLVADTATRAMAATEATHGGVQVCVKPIVARCLPSAPMSSSQQKQRGMSLACGRLIDSYAERLIEKGEFEPHVGGSKSVWQGLKHKQKIFPTKPPWRPICG